MNQRLALFGSEDLFDASDMVAKPATGKQHLGTFSADQFDLKPGDYVVHAEHGVARFIGLKEIQQGDTKGDYMLLEYAGDSKLYVPLTRMDLVQRFRGPGEGAPTLDRMGGATWSRTKSKVKARMRDMAEELVKLYASRRMAEGFAFSPDSNWQREFEDAFEFTETRDQKSAINDIRRDMESPQPMDRLLVRRCRFRQDGSGDARGVQGPWRWQASGRLGSDHGAWRSSISKLLRSASNRSLCGLICSRASAIRRRLRCPSRTLRRAR